MAFLYSFYKLAKLHGKGAIFSLDIFSSIFKLINSKIVVNKNSFSQMKKTEAFVIARGYEKIFIFGNYDAA